MTRRKQWAALLLVVPLALAPTACGDRGQKERSALEQDELSRDLDLALKGDSGVTQFEDTALAAQPAPKPEPPAATPPRRSTPPPQKTPPKKAAPVEAEPQPEPQPVPEAPRIVTANVESGTTLTLSLNETLSTQTNHVGDAFAATVAAPVTDLNGVVLIPEGATVRGRVTQVQASGRVGETAVINLAFESISFSDQSYPLDASVIEANPERVTRQTTGQQVGKVAAGAAAGAILGRILGKNTGSTIKGAVVGAAAGTAIAMGTADVDAVLKAGSRMVIRLDEPIRVERSR